MEDLEQLRPGEGERLRRMMAADEANQYLHRVLDIGQNMLQSGGEVSRVEDSIRRMCAAFGAEKADVFTITSSIVVTMYAPRFGAVTQTRRISGMQFDLTRLEKLNQLSRRICQGPITLPEMEQALNDTRSVPLYPFWMQILTYAMISAGFSLFFGGTGWDAVASGLIGTMLKLLERLIGRLQANPLVSSLLCSCLGGVLAAALVRLGVGESVAMISIGNIMLLIPGIALTNSLRDMFSGNTISGLMRFIEAILQAVVVAFGFALVAAAFKGVEDMTELIQLITAFTGSLGFAMVFQVRREKLLPAALGGLLAWGVYLLMGCVWVSDVPRFFVASVVVTIYAEILARVVKCPATLFVVTATIPLIPGGALYRTMSAFMVGDYEAFSQNGLTTILLAVAIAVGMLFPTTVFHLIQRSKVQRTAKG